MVLAGLSNNDNADETGLMATLAEMPYCRIYRP